MLQRVVRQLPKALPKAFTVAPKAVASVRFQSTQPYTADSVTAVHFRRSAVPHPLQSKQDGPPSDRQLTDRLGALQVQMR